MATVLFSMYLPLMWPFENRSGLGKVLRNVWGLFHIILVLKQARLALMSNSTEVWIHLVVAKIRIIGEKILSQNCFWSTKIG